MFSPFEETLYQSGKGSELIRVIERSKRIELRFGKGTVQSAMSLHLPDEILLAYVRYMTTGLLLHKETQQILHLGLGGGTLPKFIHQFFPNTHQDIIEKQPEVSLIAHQFFQLPHDDRIKIHITPAEVLLPQLSKRYDLIFLDTCNEDGPVDEIYNQKIFQELQKRLSPDGWVIANLWMHRVPLAQQLLVWRSVFPQLYQVPKQPISNTVILGTHASTFVPDSATVRKRALNLSQQIPLDFVRLSKELIAIS